MRRERIRIGMRLEIVLVLKRIWIGLGIELVKIGES